MLFEDFIESITSNGYGIAAMNTYDDMNRETRCYIMLSQKGGFGHFVKGECLLSDISVEFYILAGMVDKVVSSKQERAELNASREDTGSVSRFY